MIKIIKPGKCHTVTCPECECKFSYENEDIQWGDQREPYKEVECPWCKHRIDLYKVEENKTHPYIDGNFFKGI